MMKKRDLRQERERRRQEDYKKAILRAAEAVLIRKGYSATTMDDVAREAQFSKATIYRYWKSKGEMIYEIILDYFEELRLKFLEILDHPHSSTEKLRDVIRCVLEIHADKENISRVFMMDDAFLKKLKILVPGHQKYASALDKKFFKMMRAKRKEVYDAGCRIIQEGVAAGEFRKIDVGAAASIIEAALEGFLHARFFYGEHYDISEDADRIHDLFLHGLEKRD
jgi:AcrR family transcriptional regulator